MANDILQEIAESTAQAIGTAFLAALVKSMREAMDVDIVLITTGVGEPPVKARSLACWRKDASGEDIAEYDLEGTPCRLVYDGETVVITKGLYKQFPIETGFEGYVGVPVKGMHGRASGHLAVLSEKPLGDPKQAASIARLFALRAEAELQREAADREREALISSLTRANRRISRRHSELRKINETKTMLLGMMAHDLRNPLATLVSRSELIGELLRKADPQHLEKSLESADFILATAERMDRIISTMLTQAQADAMNVAVELHPTPLRRVTDIAASFNAQAAAKKSVRIIQNVPETIQLAADEDKLVECLDNLIHNAIKYSPPGSEVVVTADSDDRQALIHVTDNGQGLTPEDYKRVFRPFQRLSAAPTAGESSTGLGLAIVKTIAEAHGGSVTVSSEGRGKGATFTLSLPLACRQSS